MWQQVGAVRHKVAAGMGILAFGLVFGGCADPGEEAVATTSATGTSTTGNTATTGPADAVPSTSLVDEGDAVELPSQISGLADVWGTDWGRRTIDLDELRVGLGMRDPRDGIRPIDDPVYEDVTAAGSWLEDQEAGVLLEIEDDALFYPLRILIAHEIVNDERGGVPFAVTYCPLCNTASVFERTVDGTTLRLGVSGLLRFSDLVMWDDVTTSLWQQATGAGIVGEYAGAQLQFIPTGLIRWADFRDNHPDGEVLSRESGPFEYGANAYVGYSSGDAPIGMFFTGEIDDTYEAMSRVVGVRVDDVAKAYPFDAVADAGAINDQVGVVPIVVMWGAADTADPVDAATVAGGRPIGTGIAFSRTVDGDTLTFTANDDDTFTDAETGSTWGILGMATAGPLMGSSLDPVVHQNEFWFAWAAFNQGADVYQG